MSTHAGITVALNRFFAFASDDWAGKYLMQRVIRQIHHFTGIELAVEEIILIILGIAALALAAVAYEMDSGESVTVRITAQVNGADATVECSADNPAPGCVVESPGAGDAVRSSGRAIDSPGSVHTDRDVP
jgi:hypothetical protein